MKPVWVSPGMKPVWASKSTVSMPVGIDRGMNARVAFTGVVEKRIAFWGDVFYNVDYLNLYRNAVFISPHERP